MRRFKGLILMIIIGAILGAVFMLVILGHFPSFSGKSSQPQNPQAIGNSSEIDTGTIQQNNNLDIAEDNITSTRKNSIVKASQKVGPAVVSLSVVQVVQARTQSPFGSDFWDFFFLPPPARERQVLSLGSGVIINPEGYILTNYHVVDGAQEIKVTLTNGDELPGKLVGSDPVTDLAVVKILADNKHFPNASLGNSDDLISGEWAIAIGNPFGYLLDDPQPTVTVGVISAVNRDIKPEKGQVAVYRKMIQTDAAINPGNSGGPLVNALGEVIGINTFIFTSSRGSEGIGFAIPINRAKIVISDLLKYGEVVKSWIGLQVQNITPALAQSMNIDRTKGIVITSIADNSPASKAGFKVGDVLIAAGKAEISRTPDWEEVANYARVGRELPVEVLRDRKEYTINVVPDEIPTRNAAHKSDKFGVEVAQITHDVASYMGIKDPQGVLVMGVKDSETASSWGLQEGDIIRQIGNRKIAGLDDYLSIMSKIEHGYRIVITIERDGNMYFIQAIT